MPVPGTPRRTQSLSPEVIVAAAIDLLDAGGEQALTFRALAEALQTGPGAIYHHLSNKRAILAAAAATLVTEVTRKRFAATPEPADAVVVLLGLFDVIDQHPWMGTQLTDDPRQPALLEILEAVGGCMETHKLGDEDLFTATTALVNYLLGVAGQYAAAARHAPHSERSASDDRTAFLTDVQRSWLAETDPAQYPVTARIAEQLIRHDERQQFHDGLRLLLAGIAGRPSRTGPREPAGHSEDRNPLDHT